MARRSGKKVPRKDYVTNSRYVKKRSRRITNTNTGGPVGTPWDTGGYNCPSWTLPDNIQACQCGVCNSFSCEYELNPMSSTCQNVFQHCIRLIPSWNYWNAPPCDPTINCDCSFNVNSPPDGADLNLWNCCFDQRRKRDGRTG